MSAERYKRGRFSQITPPRWAEVRRLRDLPTAGGMENNKLKMWDG